MKIVKSILKLSLLLILLISTQASKYRNKNENEIPIRPNLYDITNNYKNVRPFTNTPYIPTEVEKLTDNSRKSDDDDISMSNAFLVGNNQYQNGRRENPSLYSTVISNHATSISHPSYQPQNFSTTPRGLSSMSVAPQASHQSKISPGEYAIPVRIDGGAYMRGPNSNGYETPSFIHKKETPIKSENVPDTNADMKNSMQKDIQTFIAQFDNAHDKKERTDILINGKKRLAEEAQILTKELESELKELLNAKEIAVKLNNVLSKYTEKLNKDQLSELKLADIVTIKAMLRDKLHREIQGFRSTPSDYKELDKLNPEDVQKVINQIKLKLQS